ncbi:MAG: hypothetical protein AOA65_0009 [Candidatus Bathyarchaeota archaeon BA1]|nr:MAG: hypothetical protein AOA65_0009 [Candidatus Bathyarchaeota archaeon BA1]
MELSVKYRDMEVKFSGDRDEVIRSFFDFLSKIFPAFELMSSLTLTIDLEDLLKRAAEFMVFTPEGSVLKVPKEQLREREAIIAHLVKTYIGYRTGKLVKDSLSIADILTLTGGKPGTVAARLSEMADLGWVERVGRGEYRVTTLGVKSFIDEILPEIKSR